MRLKRVSLVDQAVADLRARIVDGQLEPGTPLTEALVGEQLGIARPTTREVLLRLHGEGLVQRAERGMALAVTRITREELRDIYTARLHLELAGTRSFASAPRAARDALATSLAHLEDAASSPDRYTQVQADARCHTAVVALTGSRRLVAAHERLMTEARLASTAARSAKFGAIDAEGHRAFQYLLASGDVEGACTQLTGRLDSARQRLAELLPEA
ncbi:DNA-binding GntR family transcriptional regulator [Murinocardiopsis flavida]|uniref:DNA-binding GntR family transcriptional regulator n=1 Tax=Murinocardiopsis flavida TaxID=645275 RepID=A0A2P8DUG9_9ACTN|nr:GntR family transcriptional regulator [Murinocardiopsis flavida]PSL00869.1 DNA-binding GntR family transcriptional regulator [Murinocardiopsis flavida]